MNRCPITYEECGNQKYSNTGLKLLSKNLKNLRDFPYTPKEQIQQALQLATKLSIQGVQPKLSVTLNTSKEIFEIVETKGTFILKPPHQTYDELPQNEDLSMKLAALVGIEVPLHGMIYNIDGSLSYFIKRFDRIAKNKKIATEDFSQLSGLSRDTKYESSMEKVSSVIEKHCTFPIIEKIKLFRLTLFNFLIGNEDMHLKNFSLIRKENKVTLSPAYDLINTTIVLHSQEEIALPLRGKKSNLNKFDLIDYFGIERLGIPQAIIEEELSKFKNSISTWELYINHSFLSPQFKKDYLKLVHHRFNKLYA